MTPELYRELENTELFRDVYETIRNEYSNKENDKPLTTVTVIVAILLLAIFYPINLLRSKKYKKDYPETFI